MFYLLDSDSIIDYLFNVTSTIAFINEIDAKGDICTCDVVIAEVFSGLFPKSNREIQAEKLFRVFKFLPSSAGIAIQAGKWKYTYARRGIALSLSDCLIAATAYKYEATIITGNVKDYPMKEISLLPLPRAGKN